MKLIKKNHINKNNINSLKLETVSLESRIWHIIFVGSKLIGSFIYTIYTIPSGCNMYYKHFPNTITRWCILGDTLLCIKKNQWFFFVYNLAYDYKISNYQP